MNYRKNNKININDFQKLKQIFNKNEYQDLDLEDKIKKYFTPLLYALLKANKKFTKFNLTHENWKYLITNSNVNCLDSYGNNALGLFLKNYRNLKDDIPKDLQEYLINNYSHKQGNNYNSLSLYINFNEKIDFQLFNKLLKYKDNKLSFTQYFDLFNNKFNNSYNKKLEILDLIVSLHIDNNNNNYTLEDRQKQFCDLLKSINNSNEIQYTNFFKKIKKLLNNNNKIIINTLVNDKEIYSYLLTKNNNLYDFISNKENYIHIYNMYTQENNDRLKKKYLSLLLFYFNEEYFHNENPIFTKELFFSSLPNYLDFYQLAKSKLNIEEKHIYFLKLNDIDKINYLEKVLSSGSIHYVEINNILKNIISFNNFSQENISKMADCLSDLKHIFPNKDSAGDIELADNINKFITIIKNNLDLTDMQQFFKDNYLSEIKNIKKNLPKVSLINKFKKLINNIYTKKNKTNQINKDIYLSNIKNINLFIDIVKTHKYINQVKNKELFDYKELLDYEILSNNISSCKNDIDFFYKRGKINLINIYLSQFLDLMEQTKKFFSVNNNEISYKEIANQIQEIWENFKNNTNLEKQNILDNDLMENKILLTKMKMNK